MANGDEITNNGAKISLYRTYTANGSLSSTQYLPITKFKIGINGATPSITANDLDAAIPITNGTVNDDCNSAFTGSSGGDTSTNNTTTYKEGGGVTDATAQNLIANGTSVSKTWTKTVDSNFTAARYGGFWLYIKDATALAKFLTAGTAIEARWRSDASNYYSKTWTAANVAVGWNWLTTGSTLISALTATGTPGTLDEFTLIITANNSTDSFVAGDVVIDLLRTYEASDLLGSFVAGYPSLDLTNLEATIRCFVPTTQAVGFNLNQLGLFNEDTSPLMAHIATFNSESKSSLDEFAFVIKEREE